MFRECFNSRILSHRKNWATKSLTVKLENARVKRTLIDTNKGATLLFSITLERYRTISFRQSIMHRRVLYAILNFQWYPWFFFYRLPTIYLIKPYFSFFQNISLCIGKMSKLLTDENFMVRLGIYILCSTSAAFSKMRPVKSCAIALCSYRSIWCFHYAEYRPWREIQDVSRCRVPEFCSYYIFEINPSADSHSNVSPEVLERGRCTSRFWIQRSGCPDKVFRDSQLSRDQTPIIYINISSFVERRKAISFR